MGLATIGNRVFRIDPSSISWSYRIKVAEQKTVGGRVVQVYGADLGNMVVEGSIGVGGWEEQHRFLTDMEAMANKHVYDPVALRMGDPVRFIYPPKGWNFAVYVRSFEDVAGGGVTITKENFNPKWRLTLQIVDDNAALKTVAMDDFIARLSEGMGWKRTEFNAPYSVDEQAALDQGLSIYDLPEVWITPPEVDAPAPGAPAVPAL